MRRVVWGGWWCVLVLLGTCHDAFGQDVTMTQEPQQIRVERTGEWILATQGTDETAQMVKVKIWGTLREPSWFSEGFVQLDDDPEEEYCVISRNPGTGAYYKLQIIDFPPQGILVWSYDSDGRPKIEHHTIWLGEFPNGYLGAGTIPIYTAYRYAVGGLQRVEE